MVALGKYQSNQLIAMSSAAAGCAGFFECLSIPLSVCKGLKVIAHPYVLIAGIINVCIFMLPFGSVLCLCDMTD